ncbi:MAG: tetratricopeptide repeat protein, partial [Symploca sp. SIO1B1]|nr:tetratricopeptide repeat protein [Symploca sp. SIO1B1]
LYLHFLIDDLRQAEDVEQVLAKTPPGFEKYVEQQLERLDELDLPEQRWQFFALLAVAKGVLEKEDIKRLTQMRDRQLRQLHQSWQVTRWMQITEGKFYAFAHPLLATTFASQLGDDAEDALHHLIDYCGQWEDHHSSYALRYYTEHLKDLKKWEELYAIARDEEFFMAQQQKLPDEPDLPLKTVQTALLGAAKEDKAEKMAEFLLVHAHRLKQINIQESPLDALRLGSLEGALKLAEQYEIERCILWYLLLTWELKDEGRWEEAQETLKKLQQKDLPYFSRNWGTDWQVGYAAYLFAYIFEVSEETCPTFHQKLFLGSNRHLFCNFLIERGEPKAALKIAEEIILEHKQFFPLSSILELQSDKGNNQESKAIFAKALEITRKTFPRRDWVLYMGDIAKVQMAVGQREEAKATFVEAIETVQEIQNQKSRMSTLIDIADFQADVRLFSDASETLQGIDMQGASEDSWIALAEVQAKIGTREQVVTSFNRAKQIAWNIEDKVNQENTFYTIASTQAEIGELADALETTKELASLNPQSIGGILLNFINKRKCDNKDFTAVIETASIIYEKIQSPFYKAKIIKAIVAAQVKKSQQCQGDFAEALRITNLFNDQTLKAEALIIIAKGQAELRLFDQALKTASMIEIQKYKDQALVAIVQEQATTGQLEDSFITGSHIQKQCTREDALLAIAKADAQSKNFSRAIRIANRLFNPFTRFKLLKSIAAIQVEVNQVKGARNTLAIGINSSLMAELSYQQALALVNVAKALLAVSQNEKGLAYSKNAYKIVEEINEPSKKIDILAYLGKIYAKAGQRNEAIDIFTKAIDIVKNLEKQTSPNSVDLSIVKLFTTIGIWQTRAGEFDITLETVHMIKLTKDKALVLKNLAQSHPDGEHRERLKIALTTVYENALSSSHWLLDHPATTLSSIAVARMALGDREAALATFAEACELVKQEKTKKINTNPDYLLSTIAIAQAEAGETSLASENAEKIEDGFQQVATFSDIALFQSSKGDQGELLKTLNAALKAKEKISDKRKQLDALWWIAEIQAMAGQVEQAFRTAEKVLTKRNQLLCHIVTNFTQLKNKDNVKKILIPCAYSFDTAYGMCGCLAYLYPEKAEKVAKIVKEFSVS